MTVYLVRHAQALSRHDWAQPDDIRPLSRKGDRQANGLIDLLGDEPIARILSSPSHRCQATVEPLAGKLDLDIEVVNDLLEGTPAEKALRVLDELDHTQDTVVCSHGDVIPDVLRRLTARGMSVKDPLKWAKGSTWALDYDGGEFVSARYHPPTD